MIAPAFTRALLAASLVFPLAAPAATLRVPADVATIQAALDRAAPGDTVLVAPGMYLENLTLRGRDVVLESEGGPEVTIVDGQRRGTVLTIPAGSTRATVVRGFTIRNGDNHYDGAGIFIRSSSPTIDGNRVVDNFGCSGVGIESYFGSPLIVGNLVARNVSYGWSGCRGGGLYVGGAGAAEIVHNDVTDNRVDASGGGIALNAAGAPIVIGNRVLRNEVTYGRGGGLEVVNVSDVELIQNLIADNRATHGGGGVAFGVPSGARGPRLVSNTVAGNESPNGGALLAEGFDAAVEIVDNILASTTGPAVVCGGYYDDLPPTFRRNVIWASIGVPSGGICATLPPSAENVSADPLFVDPGSSYRLRPGSPAIDAGDGAVAGIPPTDLSGAPRVVDGLGTGRAVIDIGAYELLPLLWPTRVDLGVVQVNRVSAPVRVLLSNDDDVPLTVLSAAGTDEFTVTLACDQPIPARGVCPIDVTFAPRARGARAVEITVQTDRFAASIPAAGTGVAPSAVLAPATLAFGPVPVSGASAPQTVTVFNAGDAPLTVTGVESSSEHFTASSGCTSPVPPLGACTISVALAPRSAGVLEGVLTVASDSLESAPPVALSGSGTTQAASVSTAAIDFGYVKLGRTSVASVAVTNAGGDPLTVRGVAVRGPFAQTNDCGAPLAPGATCTITVSFAPTARGEAIGALAVSNDGADQPMVTLSGTGGVSLASVSPTALAFGKVTVGRTSGPQTVTIANAGDMGLEISRIATQGDFTFRSACGATLAPGALCTVDVTFAPSRRGVLSGALVVESDSAQAVAPVALGGTAVGSR